MWKRFGGEYLQAWRNLSDDTPLNNTGCTSTVGLRRCDEWLPVLYSFQNGGYNVYHRDHNFSKQGNGGYAEKVVGMVLALENGKQVEFLPERARDGKHPDLQFDGFTWDVKFINDANVETIRKYIRNGRKADNLIFYWGPGYNKLDVLKEATKRSLCRAKKNGSSIPGIYYMFNLNGLKTLYKNEIGAILER